MEVRKRNSGSCFAGEEKQVAVIQKETRLAGSKGERKVLAVFDSGASYSCINPQLAKELAIIEPLPEPMDFGTAEQERKLRATERVSLNFHLDGYRFSDEFMLIPSLSEPVIIGAATMQKWRMKLNFETDEVIIDPRVTKLRLLSLNNGTKPKTLGYEGRRRSFGIRYAKPIRRSQGQIRSDEALL